MGDDGGRGATGRRHRAAYRSPVDAYPLSHEAGLRWTRLLYHHTSVAYTVLCESTIESGALLATSPSPDMAA